MDKQQVISLLIEIDNNKLTLPEMLVIIRNYCIERGKDAQLTDLFIDCLLNSLLIIPDLTKQALNWYKRRLEIVTVLRADGLRLLYY